MRVYGHVAATGGSDRGVPLVTEARNRPEDRVDAVVERQRNRPRFRTVNQEEFTAEQLARVGLRPVVRKAAAARKPGPTAGGQKRTYPVARIVEEYVAGASSRQVAARHGVEKNTVLGFVKASGRPVRPPAPTPTAAAARWGVDRAQLVRLYRDEQRTVPQISQATGHTPGTIRRHLRAAGLTLRDDRTRGGRRNRIPVETADRIVERYQAIGNAAKVARELGVSPNTVVRTVRDRGVQVRPSSEVQTGRVGADGTVELRALMAAQDVTAAAVRHWAAANGGVCPPVGLPSRALVEEYLAATTPSTRTTAVRHGHALAAVNEWASHRAVSDPYEPARSVWAQIRDLTGQFLAGRVDAAGLGP